MKVIKVNLKENSYNIYIGYNITRKIPFILKQLSLKDTAIIITSYRIYSLYKNHIKHALNGLKYIIIKVPDGEAAKSKKWLFKIMDQIVKVDSWNKKVFIVCLGGGTVGDLGGFVASVYKRGVPYVQIPTTLLSQIDASIGGKTAINLKEAKNILGTFYQPKAVFIDPLFLTTLNRKQIKEGIAEAIKYGIIKRKDLFYFLRDNHKEIMDLRNPYLLKLISTCAEIKAKIVERDEKERKGIRTILNFGHTLAHALEASSGYKNISHGEAVSLGMLYAAKLSCFLGKCKKEDVEEIIKNIKIFRLPTKIPSNYITIYKAMGYDKKFTSESIRMVLLRGIGKVTVSGKIYLKDIKNILKKKNCC
jgi:3-dehydroquinate synthase